LTIDTYHHILPDFFWQARENAHAPVGGLAPLRWSKEASIFTAENRHHNITTIAHFMAGAAFVKTPGGKGNTLDAYRLVAADVLGSLVEDGRLKRDGVGWYVKVDA
jgi:hypothetical protein